MPNNCPITIPAGLQNVPTRTRRRHVEQFSFFAQPIRSSNFRTTIALESSSEDVARELREQANKQTSFERRSRRLNKKRSKNNSKNIAKRNTSFAIDILPKCQSQDFRCTRQECRFPLDMQSIERRSIKNHLTRHDVHWLLFSTQIVLWFDNRCCRQRLREATGLTSG